MPNNVEKRSNKMTRQTGRKRRDYKVPVRFGSDELAKLDERRAHMSRSAYIRSTALYGPTKPVVEVSTHNEDVTKLATEANRIGSNVNQMARALNTANVGKLDMIKVLLSTRDDVKELQKSVDELKQKVADLMSAMEGDFVRRELEIEKQIFMLAEEWTQLHGGDVDVDD